MVSVATEPKESRLQVHESKRIMYSSEIRPFATTGTASNVNYR